MRTIILAAGRSLLQYRINATYLRIFHKAGLLMGGAELPEKPQKLQFHYETVKRWMFKHPLKSLVEQNDL